MVVAGPMRLGDVPDVLHETADVLLFLAGMIVLTVLVEQAGVFELLAEVCARLGRGSGILLFCLVSLLGAIVTALLSLDVTVIVLTPIVYAVTIRRRLNAQGRIAEIIVANGRPEQQIIRLAEERDIALIAIGSEHPGVGPHPLSPPIRHLIDHARCDVLLLRRYAATG